MLLISQNSLDSITFIEFWKNGKCAGIQLVIVGRWGLLIVHGKLPPTDPGPPSLALRVNTCLAPIDALICFSSIAFLQPF